MWNCESCKNQNEDSFNFCWSCGEPVGVKAGTDPVNDRPIKQPISPIKVADVPVNFPQQKRAGQRSAESEKVWHELQPEKKPAALAAAEPQMEDSSAHVDNNENAPVAPAEKPIDPLESIPPVEVRTAASNPATIREPELFSTFRTDSDAGDSLVDSDWPRTIFIAGVRLVGLYLLFTVFLALPNLATLIYTALTTPVPEGLGLLNLIGLPLLMLAGKLFFYLIGGIYFVSSGRLFIRLLPN